MNDLKTDKLFHKAMKAVIDLYVGDDNKLYFE